ncbi:MAG: thioredoxin family protein, partial [Candidatus Micrarchaeota archaeon]
TERTGRIGEIGRDGTVMVLCLVALVIFAVLGVFSARYRSLAREAFSCVFRMATLRPCESGLNERLKAKVVGEALKRSPRAAKAVNHHFETLSFVFTVLFFASLAYTAYGLYNLATLGTCDPVHPENCVFKPQATNATQNVCNITSAFIEFYGAECPHCLKMIPIVAQVEAETGVSIVKLEVWHNETNQQTMTFHANEIERDCGFMGVPTFVSTKNRKAVCGEMTAEKLKAFIAQNG